MRPTKSQSWFTRFSKRTAQLTGRPATFLLGDRNRPRVDRHRPALSGTATPGSSPSTPGTTIVTFLMVFLIQCTQNRDSEAVQVKLDELLRATAGAHNALLDLEELEERELDQIRAGYGRLAKGARAALREGQADTGAPEVD